MTETISRAMESFTLNERVARQIEQRRAGARKHVHHGGSLCSMCLEVPPRAGQTSCTDCNRKAQKKFRAKRKAEFEALRALARTRNSQETEKPNGEEA